MRIEAFYRVWLEFERERCRRCERRDATQEGCRRSSDEHGDVGGFV